MIRKVKSMDVKDQKKLDTLRSYIRKIEYLRYTNNALLYWDRLTNMPRKGLAFRSEVMSFIAGEIHQISLNSEMLELAKYFEGKDPEELSIETNAMIRKIMRNHYYTSRVPVDEYTNYINILAEAEDVWVKARENNDFGILVPCLEKIVKHFQNLAEYWGYEDEPYDALLSFYEEGIGTRLVDEMFMSIKTFIIGFLKDIQSRPSIAADDVFKGKYPKEQQQMMLKDILERIGFDFEAGRLDEGVHPTILANSNSDVRIIASYQGDDFRPAYTTAFHEGGQGLYEQGVGSNLYGMFLAESSSMAMLEAVANFYENILGKSKDLLECYYPKLQSFFPQLAEVSCQDFYNAINKVSPTLIRMDADELTYNLHIIIRYEIERDLINGNISVRDLPEIWNQKYRDYLGIEPSNYAEGILQDIHWFSGYWGYFPIYMLGNLYSTQILNTLSSDMPHFQENIREGNWKEIRDWFGEKIFLHGATYSSQELIYLITDENLKPDYFIEYLTTKYREIYQLDISSKEE